MIKMNSSEDERFKEMRLIEVKRLLKNPKKKMQINAIQRIKKYNLASALPLLDDFLKKDDPLQIIALETLFYFNKEKAKAEISRTLDSVDDSKKIRELLIFIEDYDTHFISLYEQLLELLSKKDKTNHDLLIHIISRMEPEASKEFFYDYLKKEEDPRIRTYISFTLIDLLEFDIGAKSLLDLMRKSKLSDFYVRYFFNLCMKHDRQDIIEEMFAINPVIIMDFDETKFSYSISESTKNEEFLLYSDNNQKSFKEMISDWESEFVECRATLQWTHENRISKEIQYKNMKNIASFLNSKGGVLFIGVNNDREIIGLKTDYKKMRGKNQNNDGYQILVTSLIHKHFGIGMRQYIDVDFQEIERKEICFIRVNSRAPRPIFIKSEDGKSKVFYIREGNQSLSIDDPEEIFEYIERRWNYEQIDENQDSDLVPIFKSLQKLRRF